jgi:hypothetical protein
MRDHRQCFHDSPGSVGYPIWRLGAVVKHVIKIPVSAVNNILNDIVHIKIVAAFVRF